MKELTILGLGDEDGPGANTVGSSLDHLIGTWSDTDTAEFERALRHLETKSRTCARIAWVRLGLGGRRAASRRDYSVRLNERRDIG